MPNEFTDYNLVPINKTNILPLRWFANYCNHLSSRFLNKAVDLSEQENFGWRYNFNIDMWDIIDKPYRKWGTSYVYNSKTINDVVKEILESDSELLDRLGSDYDEDGTPYWIKNSKDPLTKEEWQKKWDKE